MWRQLGVTFHLFPPVLFKRSCWSSRDHIKCTYNVYIYLQHSFHFHSFPYLVYFVSLVSFSTTHDLLSHLFIDPSTSIFTILSDHFLPSLFQHILLLSHYSYHHFLVFFLSSQFFYLPPRHPYHLPFDLFDVLRL